MLSAALVFSSILHAGYYCTKFNSITGATPSDFYRATSLHPFNIETKLLVLCVKPSFNTMGRVRYANQTSIDNQKVFQMLPR